jgi:hypothetical protein
MINKKKEGDSGICLLVFSYGQISKKNEENASTLTSQLLFREVFAFVDSQLPLRFDATPLSCVLALY